jgi:hypothetical protein
MDRLGNVHRPNREDLTFGELKEMTLIQQDQIRLLNMQVSANSDTLDKLLHVLSGKT